MPPSSPTSRWRSTRSRAGSPGSSRFWEAAQILTGLSIPLFLVTHIVYNRGAASLAGTDDTYAFELGNIWPGLAWEHSLLLLVVWVHGCIGLHYWLSLAGWYRRVQPVLLALAVALPVSALAGFSVAGRQVAAQDRRARRLGEAADGLPRARCGSRRPAGDAARRPAHGFLALLGLALLVPIVRSLRRAAGAKVEVTYRGGPIVRVPLGPTLLEISRMSSVPHASVCGGRARCSTCRVGVETGLADLMPPTSAEAMTLASIMAPPHVRLACQIRPREPITVTRLVDAGSRAGRSPSAAGHPQGIERTWRCCSSTRAASP